MSEYLPPKFDQEESLEELCETLNEQLLRHELSFDEAVDQLTIAGATFKGLPEGIFRPSAELYEELLKGLEDHPFIVLNPEVLVASSIKSGHVVRQPILQLKSSEHGTTWSAVKLDVDNGEQYEDIAVTIRTTSNGELALVGAQIASIAS